MIWSKILTNSSTIYHNHQSYLLLWSTFETQGLVDWFYCLHDVGIIHDIISFRLEHLPITTLKGNCLCIEYQRSSPCNLPMRTASQNLTDDHKIQLFHCQPYLALHQPSSPPSRNPRQAPDFRREWRKDKSSPLNNQPRLAIDPACGESK